MNDVKIRRERRGGSTVLHGSVHLLSIAVVVCTGVLACPDFVLAAPGGGALIVGPVTEHPVKPGAFVYGITSDPSGNHWFAESALDAIGEIKPDGTTQDWGIEPNGVPSLPTPAVESVALDPEGSVWFIDLGPEGLTELPIALGRLAPDGTVVRYPVPSIEGESDDQLAFDGAGDLWIATGTRAVVKVVPPSPVSTPVAQMLVMSVYPLPDGTSAGYVTIGPDGTPWFGGGSTIFHLSTSGSLVAEYQLDSGYHVQAMAAGPGNSVWVALHEPSSPGPSDKIARIFADQHIAEYSVSRPDGGQHFVDSLTVGGDGNIWYAGGMVNGHGDMSEVGRVDTCGVVNQYLLPEPMEAGLQGVSWGRHDTIWAANGKDGDFVAEVSTNDLGFYPPCQRQSGHRAVSNGDAAPAMPHMRAVTPRLRPIEQRQVPPLSISRLVPRVPSSPSSTRIVPGPQGIGAVVAALVCGGMARALRRRLGLGSSA